MVFYRYLGYGTTDSNGEAKLEYDENGNHLDHSITGTGAGELDIVASLDKPISSGSIVSETYEILDCLYYGDETLDLSPSSNANIELSTEWSSTGEKSLKITPNNATSTYYVSKTFSAFSEETTLKLKVDCRTNCRIVAMIYKTSPWGTSQLPISPTTVGVFENFMDVETASFTIPSNVGWGIRFDVQAMDISSDNVSYLDNIRLYKA